MCKYLSAIKTLEDAYYAQAMQDITDIDSGVEALKDREALERVCKLLTKLSTGDKNG